MERIPILKMGEFLLVTIQVDMHDRLALTLQDDLTSQIVKHRSHGVLIDISALEMVDSFIGRMLASIAAMAGCRNRIAQTSVETGLPGRPSKGVLPRRPKISGLPGRIAIFQKSSAKPFGPSAR